MLEKFKIKIPSILPSNIPKTHVINLPLSQSQKQKQSELINLSQLEDTK